MAEDEKGHLDATAALALAGMMDEDGWQVPKSGWRPQDGTAIQITNCQSLAVKQKAVGH